MNSASSSGIIVPIRERSSAEMAEQQRVPNLEELDEKEAYIWRDRRYYAEPFEAPEWRAQWVERVEFKGSCSPELLRTP
jgi:hypothetical protein